MSFSPLGFCSEMDQAARWATSVAPAWLFTGTVFKTTDPASWQALQRSVLKSYFACEHASPARQSHSPRVLSL